VKKLTDASAVLPAVALSAAGPVTTLPAALVAVEPPVRLLPRPSLAGGLVRTARPRQWVKNLLVFAAPGAAGVLTHGAVVARTVVAFGVFCVAASGVYFLNDAADAELDRGHPTKWLRPVAAGIVPERLAVTLGAALLFVSVAAALSLGWHFALAVAAYAAVNVAYDVRLRREPVFDLAAVASGFVIRAIAGGLATGVPLSEWFLVVISAASLFVVAGKREPATVGMGASTGSRVAYPLSFLRYIRLLASGVAVTAYCLWAFDKAAMAGRSMWFEVTIVPFALAILRYALLVENGEGGSPEDILLGDRTIAVLVVAWAALFALGVYGA